MPPKLWSWRPCQLIAARVLSVGAHMITPLPGGWDEKPGSATLPFFGVVPAIVDENGKEITESPAEGYLCIKQVRTTLWGRWQPAVMMFSYKISRIQVASRISSRFLIRLTKLIIFGGVSCGYSLGQALACVCQLMGVESSVPHVATSLTEAQWLVTLGVAFHHSHGVRGPGPLRDHLLRTLQGLLLLRWPSAARPCIHARSDGQ